MESYADVNLYSGNDFFNSILFPCILGRVYFYSCICLPSDTLLGPPSVVRCSVTLSGILFDWDSHCDTSVKIGGFNTILFIDNKYGTSDTMKQYRRDVYLRLRIVVDRINKIKEILYLHTTFVPTNQVVT